MPRYPKAQYTFVCHYIDETAPHWNHVDLDASVYGPEVDNEPRLL